MEGGFFSCDLPAEVFMELLFLVFSPLYDPGFLKNNGLMEGSEGGVEHLVSIWNEQRERGRKKRPRPVL